MVQSSTGRYFRGGLMWTMGLILVAYIAGLALHGVGSTPAVDGRSGSFVNDWLALLADWLPVAVCALAVSRVGLRRPEVVLATIAMAAYAVGDTYYKAALGMGSSVPFPSPADLAFLLFYPFMMAAMVAAVRRHVRGLAGPVWLDCAVGSLGAGAVLAVLLNPVLDSALRGPLSMATGVSVAYPMFDLALVATVAGIAALRGVRVGERWILLIGGLLVFAAADVVYGLQTSANTYVVGSLLDGIWPVGLVMMALWVDGVTQSDTSKTQPDKNAVTGAMALVVPLVATAAGLGVLVMSSRTTVSVLGVALATATLLAAVVRTQVAFRQLRRMADLRVQATTDELTGLPNRRALYTQGQALLVKTPGQRRALLLLDLDKFKEVNDSLGHHAGDQLLVEMGARLRANMCDGDLLARLGGDEFAILLQHADLDTASSIADKLRAALAEPFTALADASTTPADPTAMEGLTLRSSVSIGIALFPDEGPDLSALLRKADIAMYKAKASGNGHHVYSNIDDADGATRLRTVEELRTAMTSDQLVLYYQPKIDLDSGDVHSVEALVRWEHPTRGLLYPDTFIALVEESGLMRTMTRLVLAMALDQVALWREQGQHLTVAVNLSASSLVDAGLPEQVVALLAARGVPPDALQLEITEEFLMADRDRARSILTRLRDNGVQISVDDFGTGYSSLSYLRELPIDELKLDRSFVLPMADDARAAALVASTIDLAHSLGLRMVAEGVETGEALDELMRLGCDQAQGYFMSRPVPAAELDYWLDNRSKVDQSADTYEPIHLGA